MNVSTNDAFQSINKGYDQVFRAKKLSIGLVVPLENYDHHAVPTMHSQLERIQLAEKLGFSAVWLRDVPFNVPAFGDAGQVFDPFVYLGLLAASTSKIALGVASIILPLRHPAHVAKAAASVDVLSGGRLILGVASGDRAEEYPAMNQNYNDRGERFRESMAYIQKSWKTNPHIQNTYGHTNGSIDLLPKPSSDRLPLLITGSSQQSEDWIAGHGDGWMLYPRDIALQTRIINHYRIATKKEVGFLKPVVQPLYIDLTENPNDKPRPIHLGMRLGAHYLNKHLDQLQHIGINHVALNLRFNQININDTLTRLADDILPKFNTVKESDTTTELTNTTLEG